METFDAKIFRPDLILLKNSKDLSKLYTLIEKDENFIIQWTDENLNLNAQVIVATHIIAKVKNGEMTLSSLEQQPKVTLR